jgi:hypothetical protein
MRCWCLVEFFLHRTEWRLSNQAASRRLILNYNCPPIESAAALKGKPAKPRLLFLRGDGMRGTPDFMRSHVQQQLKCLSLSFNVVTITGSCDYRKLCEQYQPDLTLFESGIFHLSII